MQYVLTLQGAENNDETESNRWWSTWSLIGCASTFSVGAC